MTATQTCGQNKTEVTQNNERFLKKTEVHCNQWENRHMYTVEMESLSRHDAGSGRMSHLSCNEWRTSATMLQRADNWHNQDAVRGKKVVTLTVLGKHETSQLYAVNYIGTTRAVLNVRGIILPKSKQDKQCTYNVTLTRVRESLLPWKSNKYYVFVCVCGRVGVCMRMRACSLVYTACNGYA